MSHIKSRQNTDSLATEILDLLDQEEPAGPPSTGNALQNARLAISRARDAGGGAVRQAYLDEAQKHIARIDPVRARTALQSLQGQVLALQGRGQDTRVAHVTPGEIVIPKRLQTPEVLAALRIVARAHGVNLSQLQVGNAFNILNPRTGHIEFQSDGAGEANSSQGDSDDVYRDADGNEIEGITVVAPSEPTIWDDVLHPVDVIARAISKQIAKKPPPSSPVGGGGGIRG